MNNVALTGRLGDDPEIRYSQGANPMCVANYTLAVGAGKDKTAWIDCVAFGNVAEFCEKYLHKGMLIGVTGSLDTNTYTSKDGVKRKSVKVVVRQHDFLEKKQEAPKPTPSLYTDPDGFMAIPDGIDEELPFN